MKVIPAEKPYIEAALHDLRSQTGEAIGFACRRAELPPQIQYRQFPLPFFGLVQLTTTLCAPYALNEAVALSITASRRFRPGRQHRMIAWP